MKYIIVATITGTSYRQEIFISLVVHLIYTAVSKSGQTRITMRKLNTKPSLF